jgi:hypothetical protein
LFERKIAKDSENAKLNMAAAKSKSISELLKSTNIMAKIGLYSLRF